MKKIGLTGGIGAGKSIVARVFATMGFPVFYSDIAGKELLSQNESVKKKVIEIFGTSVYNNGELNRTYLAEKIFSDISLKQELNNIVHPAVRDYFSDWASKQNSPIVFNEAAILFETGSYKHFDFNILISAPKSIRFERVMKRDNLTKSDVEARMKAQWSDEKKRHLANFEIVNDDKQLLIPQIEKVLKSIEK
jgi:dephospho-CoA kinase